MNVQWSRRRWVSFAVHIIYLCITFFSGLAAALSLWHEWFSYTPDAWLATAIVVGTLEILAVVSLVLYLFRIEWPLAFLRHALPFFSILPLGYKLYTLLAPNGPVISTIIPVFLSSWFVYLSFVLIRSLENLFIDSVEAAREQAKEEMGRVITKLAHYQETKRAAESFALSILPAPTPLARSFVPAPLRLEETATLSLTETADPRFATIMKLAGLKETNGSWTYTALQIQEVTRAAGELVDLVCKIVRSGQVVIS